MKLLLLILLLCSNVVAQSFTLIAENKQHKFYLNTDSITKIGKYKVIVDVRVDDDPVETMFLNCKTWKYLVIERPQKIYQATVNSAAFWVKESVCKEKINE